MTEANTQQARRRGFWRAVVTALFCGIFAILSEGPVFRVAFIVLGVLVFGRAFVAGESAFCPRPRH